VSLRVRQKAACVRGAAKRSGSVTGAMRAACGKHVYNKPF
jgi:hypothetical protein